MAGKPGALCLVHGAHLGGDFEDVTMQLLCVAGNRCARRVAEVREGHTKTFELSDVVSEVVPDQAGQLIHDSCFNYLSADRFRCAENINRFSYFISSEFTINKYEVL